MVQFFLGFMVGVLAACVASYLDYQNGKVVTKMPNENKKEGWALPRRAKYPHYIVKNRSLCGRWVSSMVDLRKRWPGKTCPVCTARLAERTEKAKLFCEFIVQVSTSLPTENDTEIEARAADAENIFNQIETLIDHLHTVRGYSIKLERR